MRPELAEAVARLKEAGPSPNDTLTTKHVIFDSGRLARLASLYKRVFQRSRAHDGEGDSETYKWDDALAYRNNFDIDAEDFGQHLHDALKPSATGAGAILGNGFSYPLRRLMKLVEYDTEGVRNAFRILYDFRRNLRDAYVGFVEAIDVILREYNETAAKPLEGSHQTPSAVSLYLAFEIPERYHYYKPSVATDFATCIGTSLAANAISKMFTYQRLADTVLPELLADTELVALSDGVLTDDQRSVDPAHHLMLQDIAYYASYHLKLFHSDWAEILADDKGSEADNSPDENVFYPKNLILYGPPGTGKTYRTRAYAVAICDGRNVEDVLEAMEDRDGRDDVNERYAQLVDEGRVGFTTFHQSYGYEEFIEGMRPEYDEDKGVVTYPLRKGLFREFCEAAEDVVAVASAEEGIPRFDANPRPRVWKMGLKTSEVADLLEHCRNEGTLRMG